MDITKLRYNGSKVDLELTRKNGQDLEAVAFGSKDTPQPSFVKALNDVKGDFLYFMELPSTYEKLELHGVRVSSQGSVPTYKFLGGLRVGAGFTSVNSPTLYAPTEEMSEGDAIMTAAQHKRVLALLKRGVEYYLGARHQDDLFDPVEASTEGGEEGQDVEEDAEATEVQSVN